MTRNAEIGKTPVWGLPNIWRLGRVRDTKIGSDVSMSLMKCYWILQSARVTAFTASELLRENQQGGGLKLPPPIQNSVKRLAHAGRIGNRYSCVSVEAVT